MLLRPALALVFASVLAVSTNLPLAFAAPTGLGADPEVTPVPAPAVRRAATVQVRVTPDRPGWTCAVGETANFRVSVIADQQPVPGAVIRYEVGPELAVLPSQTATVPAEGLVIPAGTLAQPGFIRCAVTTEVGGRTYRGVATIGFSPEKILPLMEEPADFDAFWAAGKAELARVPMEPLITFLPEASTGDLNVYHVGLRTVGPTTGSAQARVYGILCEPKAPGSYPAILRVPGAGVRPYGGDQDFARRGAITLEIGVHGIPVNQLPALYDQLFSGPLDSYWTRDLDDRQRYYYRRVILSCLRAADFLTTRSGWNGRDLIVGGASQGGMLAICTAALEPRVSGLVAIHPAFCDLAAPLQGRAGGWPHLLQPGRDGSPSAHATPARIATLACFDTVAFARRVRAPGHYIWGYNDEVCPPTSTFAAFNVIPGPKELTLMLEQAHTYPPEQYESHLIWTAAQLGWKL